MDQRRRRRLIAVIIAFASVCIAVCGYLVFKTISTRSGAEEYSRLQSSYAPGIVSGTENREEKQTEEAAPSENEDTTSEQKRQTEESPVDFRSLMKINPEVYSWIYVPNTNVNYPVLQSYEDDNFYLDHDVYKNYSFPGAIYSQSCNSRDWSDRVTLLYGHNMLDGSMFASLHRFENESFFNENPYFYIYTADRTLTYKIVTAFDYDDKHIMNSYDFSRDEVFRGWIDQATSPRSLNANVRSDAPIDLNAKFVVLSTCQNYGDGRYLVQGVLINDERTE